MKKNLKNILKVGGPGSMLTIGIVVGSIMLSNVNPIEVEEIKTRSWKRLFAFPPTGDSDPGAGNSGVMRVVITKNASSPTVNFNQSWNATADEVDDYTTCYAYGDSENDIGQNVPHTTNFDIAVKVRFHSDDMYVDGTWRMDYVNASFYCLDADMLVDPAVACTKGIAEADGVLGDTDDTYAYVWFVYGAPSTIGTNATIEADGTDEATFDIWAYTY